MEGPRRRRHPLLQHYLGLCAVPEVVKAGKDALDRWGAGSASVRFICGTFTVHRELEKRARAIRGWRVVRQRTSAAGTPTRDSAPPVLERPDVVISDQP